MTPTRNKKGFTLIEIIVVLILVGILAAIAGMGIASGVNGYFFARDNAETAQKGQLAMVRISKEMNKISSVSTLSNATTITFTSNKQGADSNNTITRVGQTITLNGDILTDNVALFNLGYYDAFNGPEFANWNQTTRKIIEVTLSLSGADNITSNFTARIAPRNL